MQILDDLLALFVTFEIDLRILTLPQGTDPCDVIASQGCEVFKQHLSTAVDALEHKIQAVTNGLDSAPGTHQSSQAVEEILGTLARAFPARSGATSTALVREQQVMTRISRQFGIDEETLQTRLVGHRREQASRSQRPSRVDTEHSHVAVERPALNVWEKELIELLLHHTDQLAKLADALLPEDIPNQFCRSFFERAVEILRSGQTPSYAQMMLFTDELQEKNVLVECDEYGREKAGSDPEQRVNDLLERVKQRKQRTRQNEQVAVFHQKTLPPQQEDEELNQLFKELSANQDQTPPDWFHTHGWVRCLEGARLCSPLD